MEVSKQLGCEDKLSFKWLDDKVKAKTSQLTGVASEH